MHTLLEYFHNIYKLKNELQSLSNTLKKIRIINEQCISVIV